MQNVRNTSNICMEALNVLSEIELIFLLIFIFIMIHIRGEKEAEGLKLAETKCAGSLKKLSPTATELKEQLQYEYAEELD